MNDSLSILPAARRRLNPPSTPNPVMQVQEDGGKLIPFAKRERENGAPESPASANELQMPAPPAHLEERGLAVIELVAEYRRCSRVVSRYPLCSPPSQSHRPVPQCCGDVFWENLSQRPNPNSMEEQYIPPILRVSGCSQPGLYPIGGLPPPETLWRRKRRNSERMRQGPRNIPARVRAVTYHLEDLRRRQRSMHELKKAQWGSSGAAPECTVLEEAVYGLPSTTEYADLDKERAAYSQEEDHLVTPGRAQLLWAPWSPLGQERACASGRLSSQAYGTVTATRNPTYNPGRMELESEE